jgi:hypothetical protein
VSQSNFSARNRPIIREKQRGGVNSSILLFLLLPFILGCIPIKKKQEARKKVNKEMEINLVNIDESVKRQK